MPLINRINKNKKKQSISSNNINSIKNSSQVNKNRLKERILQRLQKQRERNRKIQEEQLNQQLQQKKEKAREREQLKQKNRKIRTIASQSSSKTSTQKPKFFSQKPKPKSKPLKSLMTHAQKKKLSKKPILTKEQPNAKVIEFKPDYAVSQRKQHSKQSQQKVIRPKKPINVHNLTKKQIIHLSLERRNSLYQQIEEKATQIKQKLRQLQVNKQPLPFELVKELHTSNNVLKYINGIKESEIQAREQQMLKEGTYNQTIKANAEENKSSSQSSQILTTSKEKALKQKSKTNTTKEFLKKSYEERFCEKIGEKGKERLNSLVKKWQNNYGINISRHTKEYSKINEIRKMLEKVESAHKANFLYYGVAKVLELKPSVEQFKSYGLELIKMLEKFESRYKANFLYYGVAKVLELKQ